MTNNFIFLGDSLTSGYGVSKKDCWVSLLSTKLDLNIINTAVNGSTTTDMLFKLSDILSNDYKNIFIMGGTNDLLSNRPINSIVDNMDLIIRECINLNKKIILGIPPVVIPDMANKLFIPSLTYKYCSESLPELRTELIKLCNKYKIIYLDFYTITLQNIASNIFIDGIHLNKEGQKYLYKEALKIKRLS